MSPHGIHLDAMAERGAAAVKQNVARRPDAVTISRVLVEVSTEFDVPVRDLLGPWRHQRLVVVRHAAMALARRHTSQSLPSIGRTMQRDHTTVLDGIARHEQREAADPDLAARVAAVSERLQRGLIHA